MGTSPIFKKLFAKPPSTGNHPHIHPLPLPSTSTHPIFTHYAFPPFHFSNPSTGSIPSLDSSSQLGNYHLGVSNNEPAGVAGGQGLTSSSKTSTKNVARRTSRHSFDQVDLLGVSPTAVIKPSGGDNDSLDSSVKTLTVAGVATAVSSEFRRASSFKASSMLTALFGTLNESQKSNNNNNSNDPSSIVDSQHSRAEGDLGLRHGLPSSDSIDERIPQNNKLHNPTQQRLGPG